MGWMDENNIYKRKNKTIDVLESSHFKGCSTKEIFDELIYEIPFNLEKNGLICKDPIP